MWANATCDDARGQCGGYEPEQVLVAYVLSQFSGFLWRDVPNRIRIRTMFELGARHLITTVQAVTAACCATQIPDNRTLTNNHIIQPITMSIALCSIRMAVQ